MCSRKTIQSGNTGFYRVTKCEAWRQKWRKPAIVSQTDPPPIIQHLHMITRRIFYEKVSDDAGGKSLFFFRFKKQLRISRPKPEMAHWTKASCSRYVQVNKKVKGTAISSQYTSSTTQIKLMTKSCCLLPATAGQTGFAAYYQRPATWAKWKAQRSQT